MRLNYMLLVLATPLLSNCDAIPAIAKVSNLEAVEPVFGESINRILRTQEANTDTGATDDEERAWNLNSLLSLVKLKKTASDFSRANLDKMLADPVFKQEMFLKWERYPTDKILAAIKLTKTKNKPYGPMLQEYLNRASNDFSQANLDLMLVNRSFKQVMFLRWDTHPTDEILAAITLNNRENMRYGSMLLEYLNRAKNTAQ